MIHLTEKGGKFFITEVSTNHEVIKQSQRNGITTRKGAYKNIIASAKHYHNGIGPIAVLVQDDASAKRRMVIVSYNPDTKKLAISGTEKEPGKEYIHGRRSSGRAAKRHTAVKKVN